jgi:hypothetical protein
LLTARRLIQAVSDLVLRCQHAASFASAMRPFDVIGSTVLGNISPSALCNGIERVGANYLFTIVRRDSSSAAWADPWLRG